MKKSPLLLLIFLPLLATIPQIFADYPIVSHRYLADPGAMAHNGRVYVYCSNDDDNTGSAYAMKSIVCVSSADMKNWTDHGEVFRVPNNAGWASYSWAPAAIARNGKIYLYFGNNASGVGVASSTSPTGPFTDAKGGYLINSSTPGASGTNMWYFDPSVFVDDNGQAYLSFGGNGVSNCRIIRLNSDMISVSGSASAITLPGYFEASHLHKRNGLYYLSYSTNTSNGLRIDYATSSSPMSGYTRRGIAAGQPPNNNNNNHATIVNFNGTWYHIYHNRIVSNLAVYKRNLAVERLNYNSDGTIQQVTYTTNGVPQIGTVNPYARVEAETTNGQSGIETETCSEGGMDVGYLQNGDWIRIRGVNFGSTGARGFSARVASGTSGGNIELRLGSTTGTLIGTCSVVGTGGWQNWTTRTATVNLTTGTHDLYLRFTGGSDFLMNVNWWQFNN
jgi:arabinoxylan arabinofuranohydrolase